MNANDFLVFLGHSSINESFDAFLENMGIVDRPKVGKKLETTIYVNGKGLTLHFELLSAAQEKHMPIKSQGTFIFDFFTLMIIADDKKHGKYTGPIPGAIEPLDTRAQVETKLGTPKRRNQSSDNYFVDGHVWTVVFEESKLSYIRIQLPDDNWRQHKICP